MSRTICSASAIHRLIRASNAAVAGIALTVVIGLPASAQTMKRLTTTHSVVVPTSSTARPEDKGLRAHTNVRFLDNIHVSPTELPPFAGYGYETPASFACIYGLAPKSPGCNPNTTTVNPSGGSQAIAIVDAFDDPNAAADLAFFSQQFGLPYSDANFHVVYSNGSVPPVDPSGGWELEESLDIEYTHAMAPNATIYLVEAPSNSFYDLFAATQVASNLIVCGQTTTCPAGSKGKGEVTMSFGASEFSQESYFDSIFTTPGVVYFASSGDEAGSEYPCVSPNVVCVGGTTNSRSIENGNLIEQIGWSDAGSGISYYEPIPSYQASHRAVAAKLSGARGVPDIAADANPVSGAWVWNTNPYEGSVRGWTIVGGTSLASPLSAGITNAAGAFLESTNAYLTNIYTSSTNFTDVTYGACYYYSAYYSGPGWDLCTGMGTPKLQ